MNKIRNKLIIIIIVSISKLGIAQYNICGNIKMCYNDDIINSKIVLFNKNNQVIDYIKLDTNNVFCFYNLDSGYYFIKVIKVGYSEITKSLFLNKNIHNLTILMNIRNKTTSNQYFKLNLKKKLKGYSKQLYDTCQVIY